MKIQITTSRFNRKGLTLIEVSLVIALLLGLISIVFLGIGSYRKGADKAKCKMQLSQIQKTVRAHANFNNLAIGAAFAEADAFGTGKPIATTTPVCPSGGTITWSATIPAIGTPYGNCAYTDADDASLTHVLATTDTEGW
ncbi:MAG: hypothetical protein CJBNEKGG_00255 [Prosthecobacter sp.]|nr:hypothetical protein [Prosthecobacter sp.]